MTRLTKKAITKIINERVTELWRMQSNFAEKGRAADNEKRYLDVIYYQNEEMRAMYQRWELLNLADKLGIKLEKGC